ncbi:MULTISPECIES: DNA topoisomerase III [Geobacillus]|jgi:DNA topoisomerase III|uniref:DNA topoisomerase n=2 Tax=Geobacillus thermodenitrificans TaxID=33940 RepID=A4INJ7_GEOTN|nr:MULTISPECIES: DNA topoisomerase III [Geobacillus]ABO66901.1 DNA topoisomerase III [Geobacillus thermodenitrificans NG80-2]ARA96754.1 DNA topoisomerase III [Geobacillus thermodenitrificans]ARP42669.1 DNA topoisomerase 3 [Geobacillus thermodenitrificans]ATO36027.1 DNA topoisomerase III [Geobacillus thermodenitrificans]KQB93468.1 DNA topoisomerase 3 [Geobacillus sp. PA-3]
MKSLVLAEKPSVARDIARVLGCKKTHKSYLEGPRYIVTWALGHLVELKMPEDYDRKYETWRLEDLPIIPKKMGLKVIRQTSHQFRAIERLAKRRDVKDCIIATDAGREGELVARWILQKIDWKKPIWRLWISSQTDQAIRDGFRQLKPGTQFDRLYESAICRAEADWLIGLNVTRALTTKYNDPLSAGRVQTPTLAMIIEREREIQSFVPVPYWTIHARIGSVTAVWERHGGKRLFDKDEANELMTRLKGQPARVTSVKRKRKSEPVPLPYDLTELQREANKRFGFSAKKTLSVLQRLYEQHKLVTYPRTDSRYLPSDMKATMTDRLLAMKPGYEDVISSLLTKKNVKAANRVFQDDKVTDHHAIIPTDERLDLAKLSVDERKLYDMIARRFLALFYPPYEYETATVVFEIGDETFVARETAVVNAGFKAVLGKEETEAKPTLLHLSEGQTLASVQLEMEQSFTEPPSRYSEADLLAQMERYGLGTPATRADIIERLVETEVVERKDGRFYPTKKGKQLIELVNEELKSPELTARWERELEAIARGKGNPKQFLANIRRQTEQLVTEIKQSEQTYKAPNLTNLTCPECGSLLKERKTKDGRMLVCSNLECRYRRRRDPKLSNRRCPQCHRRMEMHEGKAGLYFQCRPCNIVEKAEETKRTSAKGTERALLKKYSPSNESFGTSLGELLKQALEKKE